MTHEQFQKILVYLDANHPELVSKFPSIVLGEDGGFFIFKPAKVTDDEYNKIIEITNKWRDENNA